MTRRTPIIDPKWGVFEEDGGVHVAPLDSPHTTTPDCWCDPEVKEDSQDGTPIYVHRQPN